MYQQGQGRTDARHGIDNQESVAAFVARGCVIADQSSNSVTTTTFLTHHLAISIDFPCDIDSQKLGQRYQRLAAPVALVVPILRGGEGRNDFDRVSARST